MRPGIAFAVAALAVVTAACASPAGKSPVSPSSGRSSAPIASPETPVGVSPSLEASSTPSAEATTMASTEPFTIASTAFADGEAIPAEFTCKGADVSPPLAWSGVPTGTRSLILFVDDPDGRDWVHWSVLDLDPTATGLPRDVQPDDPAIRQGRNDFGKVGYGGPCPPSGTHHYQFTLSALAKPLGVDGEPDGSAVRAALRSADVLGTARLVGTVRA